MFRTRRSSLRRSASSRTSYTEATFSVLRRRWSWCLRSAGVMRFLTGGIYSSLMSFTPSPPNMVDMGTIGRSAQGSGLGS